MPVLWFVAGAALAGGVSALATWFVVGRQKGRVIRAERRASRAERLAELGTLTGGLAHEIKNPLSTIGLNSQLLAEDIADAGLPDESRRRIERRIDTLRREVDRLSGILTDFLQFAGRVRLDSTPTDINILIEELIDFFMPQAQNAGVRLHFQPAREPIVARVDPGLLKQAILNLLLNASEALETMPKEHPRELMVRVERKARPEPAIELHVTDTGPGLSDKNRSRIFQPYFSTKRGGTGLGLPTTRRIVEEHGGRIDVHSEAGRGTVFVIRLPAEAEDGAEIADTSGV